MLKNTSLTRLSTNELTEPKPPTLLHRNSLQIQKQEPHPKDLIKKLPLKNLENLGLERNNSDIVSSIFKSKNQTNLPKVISLTSRRLTKLHSSSNSYRPNHGLTTSRSFIISDRQTSIPQQNDLIDSLNDDEFNFTTSTNLANSKILQQKKSQAKKNAYKKILKNSTIEGKLRSQDKQYKNLSFKEEYSAVLSKIQDTDMGIDGQTDTKSFFEQNRCLSQIQYELALSKHGLLPSNQQNPQNNTKKELQDLKLKFYKHDHSMIDR